jgi:hypothetical protein
MTQFQPPPILTAKLFPILMLLPICLPDFQMATSQEASSHKALHRTYFLLPNPGSIPGPLQPL